MAENLTVAWAILVDAITLGASIEAHASTERTASNFLNFIGSKPTESAAGKLPNELVAKIITHAQQMHHFEHERKWNNAWWCFHGRCSVSEHLSEEEHKYRMESFLHAENIRKDESGRYWMDEDEIIYEEAIYEAFDDTLRQKGVHLKSDVHWDNVGFMLLKMDNELDTDSDDVAYRKAREVFAKDFGLEPHFQKPHFQTEKPERDPPAGHPLDWMESYLLLPADHAVLRATAAGHLAPLEADMIVDQSNGKEPTEAQKQIFTNAIRALDLK